MTAEYDDFRGVPRAPDSATKFLTAEKDLGVFLATIVPRSPELLEEVAYFDASDGSQISLRRDRVTYTPHVLSVGARAAEFHQWATTRLDCWPAEEILAEAAIQLRGNDIDGLVDAAVVLFISAPPVRDMGPRWLQLALEFFEHADGDVRDAAVAGAHFRLWEAPEVRYKIEAIAKADPSEVVRANARVLWQALESKEARR